MPAETLWYSHLSIDVLARVLDRSLFHPFIAWLIPLCLRAVATPYHAPEFIASCVWAVLVTLFVGLGVFNKRLAHGIPRQIDWDEEVVVVTGGASGLGKIIAETYGMRGASVAVLDVQAPSKECEELTGVQFYTCDVANAEAVQQAKRQIEKNLGIPTILINNAGIVSGKSLLNLAPAEAERCIGVNLLAHFHTIHAFLPEMLRSETGATIVTISSVLGKLGASHLSDYTAAKAGLIALHASLRAELASPTSPEGARNVRTILVTPGQLSTRLFAGVKPPSTFFGPVVEPVELAREVVQMIDAGESGEISMPLYARYIDWIHVLPASMQRLARWLSGMDRAMEASVAQRCEMAAEKSETSNTAEYVGK